MKICFKIFISFVDQELLKYNFFNLYMPKKN